MGARKGSARSDIEFPMNSTVSEFMGKVKKPLFSVFSARGALSMRGSRSVVFFFPDGFVPAGIAVPVRVAGRKGNAGHVIQRAPLPARSEDRDAEYVEKVVHGYLLSILPFRFQSLS